MSAAPVRKFNALESLAREHLGDLSIAEVSLLRSAFSGQVVSCNPSEVAADDSDNDPAGADAWGPERNVRAEVVRWLCTTSATSEFIDVRGIQIRAARITDYLDLSFVTVPFPIAFRGCRFMEPISLVRAQVPFLSLTGSRTGPITADGATVADSVLFSDGFCAEGEVSLSDSEIRGTLACNGGSFKKDQDGAALVLDRAEVIGGVAFTAGFAAEGEVRLNGAHIKGNLDCNGGSFQNLLGLALSMNGAKVDGAVIFAQGFVAKGEVQMTGARVGADVICRGASFQNIERNALQADRAVVAGAVVLSGDTADSSPPGFIAQGEVRFSGAEIGTALDCTGGLFENPAGLALTLDGAKVAGSVFLCNKFKADGEVSFAGTRIDGDLNCYRGLFRNPSKQAVYADRINVAGSIFFNQSFRAEGGVILVGARIGGDLDCIGGSFKNPGEIALWVSEAKVGRRVLLNSARSTNDSAEPSFSVEGAVLFARTEIGGDLKCSGAVLKCPGKSALYAERAIVGGSVFFNEGFRADGVVALSGTQIRGDLDCSGGIFEAAETSALLADRLNVGGSVLLSDGFRAEGGAILDGTKIGADLNCHNGIFNLGGGEALSAERTNVAGSILLTNCFHANGWVNLVAAEVGGDIQCSGGTFSNPGQYAILATEAKVTRSVFFNRFMSAGGNVTATFCAEGEVRIASARIGGYLDCASGIFKDPGKVALNARGLMVQGNVSVGDGFVAEGEVLLAGADIGGNLYCTSGSLSKLSARRATIKGDFHWRLIHHAHQTTLNLTDVSAGGIRDDEVSWPTSGNLNLDGFVYSRISPSDASGRLEWLRRQKHFRLQPYRQLAKVLSDRGDERGAQRVLFEMERRRRAQSAGWLSALWSQILRWTVGYGFFPGRALGWLLGLVLIGTMFFGVGYLGGAVAPTDKEAYAYFEAHGQPPEYYPRFNAFAYSFEHAAPLISLGQKDHWAPKPLFAGKQPIVSGNLVGSVTNRQIRGYYLVPRLCAVGFLRLWLWLQIVLGWVLATLFVAGLTGIVRGRA
jgi:hypothetical protein